MSIILKAENISKQYRLGQVGTGTLAHDINRWWHLMRGKEDPYLQIGSVNDRSAKATEDYVWALRDINFEVEEGEVLGIIGKNGAGKSTLLKILSRVTIPTTGAIKSKGRIASLLEVGTGFHPELTGRENIYLNGAILGMTKKEIDAKVDEIVDFSGCEMYIDTPTKRYSSGMTVRLAFAVAAHLEPDILVVDEVLAVGDAEFQKKAIGKMQQISTGEGRTVLFVSHNMTSVTSLCSRGIVLENGIITMDDEVSNSVDYYLRGGNENSNLNVKNFSANNSNILNKIEFISAKIIASKKGDFAPIRMDDEILLEYKFKLIDQQSHIHINSWFLDDYGNVIFGTKSKSTESRNNIDKDVVIFSMTIHPNFFNQGDFSINIGVVENEEKTIYKQNDFLKFSVIPEPIELGGFMSKTKGLITPNFIWEIN